MGSPAIFKGSYTKLLTALGLSIESGQHIKWVDGAALYAVLVSDAGGVLTLQALPAAAVPSLDASKITSGVLDVARIPPAALERLVVVADQAARYALTTATVQLGDTVLQSDTNILYMVKDEANLGNANGYQAYVAATAADVPNSVVLAKVLTGMVLADGAPVATDTILQAFGKLSRVPLTDASNQALSGFTATSVVGALNEEKAATVDQESTGWVSFSGAGNYYSYSSGTFTVLRAGVGRIKGQKITWAGGESVSGLAANKGYLIGYSATNTLVAIDITTLENTSKKVLMDNYLSAYTNNVMLFGIWTDGANPVVVKETHEYAYPTEISIHDHFRLGQTFSFSGAQLSVLNAAARTIQTSGEDLLDDHGLETRVPDAAGSAVDAMAIFQNAGGVAQGLNRRTFTVSGITTAPTAGATYTNNGSTFTVVYTTLTGVAPNITGTIATWTSSGNNNPTASGTLTKTSGTGDATISYSAYAVPNTISTIYAPAGVPTSLGTGGATRYGIVAVYCSKDDLQTPSTAAPTPKYFQVLSNTAYNSTANAANSIGTGASPDLSQFVIPNEMKAIELVLNGFVIVDGSTRSIPSVATNGFVNGVKTTKAVLGASSLAGAVSATTANNVSLDTSNFNGNLSSLDINDQVSADTIDDIPMVKGRNYLNRWNTCVSPIGTIDTGVSFAAGQTRANPGNWACTDTAKLTISQTTTNPLDGVYSYVLTNGGAGAASVQTPLFTLGLIDVGQPQTIKFDISGVTASGDYAVFLDRYNSSNVLQENITPALSLLPTGTGRFSTFAIPSNTAGDKYALRFARLSGSDTASPKIDELYIGPNSTVQGAAIGAWKVYTPASTNGLGTVAFNGLEYRENGSSIDIRGRFTTGTVTASEARIQLPTGYTANSSSAKDQSGNWWRDVGSGSARKKGCILVEDGQNYFKFGTDDFSDTVSPYSAQNGDTLFNSSQAVNVYCSFPVNELSSNVTLANRAVEEYASNSNATNTAADSTSFAYGPTGSLIPNGATGTTYERYVQFRSPIQSTDVITLETDRGTSSASWYPVANMYPFVAQGSNSYGTLMVNISSTQLYISFRPGGYSPTGVTYGSDGGAWSVLASWRWRVRKVSGAGASVGYPISSANIVGRTDGVAPASGMLGQMVGTQRTGTNGNAFTVRSTTAPTNSSSRLIYENLGVGNYWVSFSVSAFNPDGSSRDFSFNVQVGGTAVTQTLTHSLATGLAQRVTISVPVQITATTEVGLYGVISGLTGSSGGVHEMSIMRMS